jgi:hypothetical protein
MGSEYLLKRDMDGAIVYTKDGTIQYSLLSKYKGFGIFSMK